MGAREGGSVTDKCRIFDGIDINFILILYEINIINFIGRFGQY